MFSFFNCDDNEENVIIPPAKSIASIASSNSDLTCLVAVLNKAGLTVTLSGSGSYTVFAPTNIAFSNISSPQGLLQEFNWATLNDVPEAVLEKTLKYHVVLNANVLSNNFPTT